MPDLPGYNYTSWFDDLTTQVGRVALADPAGWVATESSSDWDACQDAGPYLIGSIHTDGGYWHSNQGFGTVSPVGDDGCPASHAVTGDQGGQWYTATGAFDGGNPPVCYMPGHGVRAASGGSTPGGAPNGSVEYDILHDYGTGAEQNWHNTGAFAVAWFLGNWVAQLSPGGGLTPAVPPPTEKAVIEWEYPSPILLGIDAGMDVLAASISDQTLGLNTLPSNPCLRLQWSLGVELTDFPTYVGEDGQVYPLLDSAGDHVAGWHCYYYRTPKAGGGFNINWQWKFGTEQANPSLGIAGDGDRGLIANENPYRVPYIEDYGIEWLDRSELLVPLLRTDGWPDVVGACIPDERGAFNPNFRPTPKGVPGVGSTGWQYTHRHGQRLAYRARVTPRRYRYRYGQQPVRQWPRDDGKGLSAAPRVFPPAKSGRVVGSYP